MNILDNITGKKALKDTIKQLEDKDKTREQKFGQFIGELLALRDTNKELIKSNRELDDSHQQLIRTHNELIEVSDKLRERVEILLHEVETLKDELKESHKEVMDGIHGIGKEKPLEVIDLRSRASHHHINEIERKENETIKLDDNTVKIHDQDKTNEQQKEETPEKVFDGANHIFIKSEIEGNEHDDKFISPEIREIHEATEKEEQKEKVSHEDKPQQEIITQAISEQPTQAENTPKAKFEGTPIKLSANQKKILAYIKKHPDFTMTKIKDGVNISATANYLKILLEKGLIKKDGKTYSIVEN